MKKHYIIIGTAGFVIGLLMVVVLLLLNRPALEVQGSAPSGLSATLATSSKQSILPNSVVILTATSSCSSRVISTRDIPIMLMFGEINATDTPSATFGHFQAASTTVAYDSGVYGCGMIRAFGLAATSSGAGGIVNISDFR